MSIFKHPFTNLNLANVKTKITNQSTPDSQMQNTNRSSEQNHVLLIEDNPADAKLVEILLEESDMVECKITHHYTLQKGIAELDKQKFAAVLLDLSLPDSHGFETLEKLIAHSPNLNVIVLTGHSDKKLGLQAVKFGAQDFLVKGEFDSELLAKTLRYSVERNSVITRLEETQRLAHIGNWEYHPQQRFFASDELYRIFKLSPHHNSNTVLDIQNETHPLHLLTELHQETLANGDMLSKDIRIQLHDDSFRHVNIRCKIHGKKNHYYSTGIIQNITYRKKVEKEFAKTQERYQDIFTRSKDAIYISSLDGKLVDFNDATVELFGVSREKLKKMESIHRLFYSDERRNEFFMKLKIHRSVKDFPIEVSHKHNEVRHCLVNAHLIVDDDYFLGYNCTIRDITERKQAEKMKKARDLARQSAKMKEQFIASVSHEMRTPMNAILGMSNILAQMEMGEEQAGLVKNIKHSSEILLGIVNDILEISTIQNGKVVFENKTFNLSLLLSNLMNVMQYKATEKNLHLQVIYDEEIPSVLSGDPLRLNQILYNLVGNAIKFTDSGYVKLYVKKMNDILDSVQLKFIVEDSGIGIPEDKVEAIFETFTRIRQKDRLYEGTGLGLSIVKNLVEQQGGKVGVTSKLDEGSKFFFDIILEVGDEKNLPKPENRKDLNTDFDDDSPFRLLLVEDHKMNQLVARKTLERKFKNIELSIADNGQIAIEMLENDTFDLILMDIQMPIMDGYEATQHIRKNMPPSIAKLPILAMTAHAHIAKDGQYKKYGMDDFVLKPFEPENLFQKIRTYVQKSRTQ